MAFERVAESEIPSFEDDMDPESLRKAVNYSLDYYARVPENRVLPLGDLELTVQALKSSLEEFKKLMDEGRLDRESIVRSFDVFQVRGLEQNNAPLVTGYYEPVLEGRLQRDSEFCYPLYGVPPDLLTVDLAAFNNIRFAGEQLVGRLKDKRVIPYYTRAEIDGEQKLEGAECKLVWLRDPVDIFFLHIQGSGMIRMPGGQYRRVGYAGTNGRPYRSIGKDLLDKGVLKPEEISLQTIREYLRGHPEVCNEIMWRNESYVFFRWVKEGPVGSLNVPLTAGRSIAMDGRYQPRGALAFLFSEKPQLDLKGEVRGWEPLHRWVLNQDTGGAIKGVGRVDLFCGTGEAAESIAGRLKQDGKIYFLIKRGTI